MLIIGRGKVYFLHNNVHSVNVIKSFLLYLLTVLKQYIQLSGNVSTDNEDEIQLSYENFIISNYEIFYLQKSSIILSYKILFIYFDFMYKRAKAFSFS